MSGLDNVLAAFGGAGAPPKESPLEAIVTQQGGSLRPIAVGEFQPPLFIGAAAQTPEQPALSPLPSGTIAATCRGRGCLRG